MKWVNIIRYVDLETGEILIDKPENIIIIKTEKKSEYVNYAKRIARITKWFRRTKYKQPPLFTTSRNGTD